MITSEQIIGSPSVHITGVLRERNSALPMCIIRRIVGGRLIYEAHMHRRITDKSKYVERQ